MGATYVYCVTRRWPMRHLINKQADAGENYGTSEDWLG